MIFSFRFKAAERWRWYQGVNLFLFLATPYRRFPQLPWPFQIIMQVICVFMCKQSSHWFRWVKNIASLGVLVLTRLCFLKSILARRGVVCFKEVTECKHFQIYLGEGPLFGKVAPQKGHIIAWQVQSRRPNTVPPLNVTPPQQQSSGLSYWDHLSGLLGGSINRPVNFEEVGQNPLFHNEKNTEVSVVGTFFCVFRNVFRQGTADGSSFGDDFRTDAAHAIFYIFLWLREARSSKLASMSKYISYVETSTHFTLYITSESPSQEPSTVSKKDSRSFFCVLFLSLCDAKWGSNAPVLSLYALFSQEGGPNISFVTGLRTCPFLL